MPQKRNERFPLCVTTRQLSRRWQSMTFEPWFWPEFFQALYETLYMVSIGMIISMIIGIPLGIILVITRENGILENKIVFNILNVVINIFRSRSEEHTSELQSRG